MGVLRFYWQVLRVAVTHSLSRTHDFILGAVILLGVAAYFGAWLHMKVDFTSWIAEPEGWRIAATTFGGIVVLRLLLAPYWLWRAERDGKCALQQAMAPEWY